MRSHKPVTGESSNGRTTDSDSVYLGSSPSSPTMMASGRSALRMQVGHTGSLLPAKAAAKAGA